MSHEATKTSSNAGTEVLVELARATAAEYWEIVDRKPNVAGLVAPPYRETNAPRYSEQEARFAFARLAVERGWRISVETPTRHPHKFTGADESPGRSGQHDLSLWAQGPDGEIVGPTHNVEFKHGSPTNKQIEKDLEKLACSEAPALIFHSHAFDERSKAQAPLLDRYRACLGRVLAGPNDKLALDHPVVLAFCNVIAPQRAWLVDVGSWRALQAAIARGLDAAQSWAP